MLLFRYAMIAVAALVGVLSIVRAYPLLMNFSQLEEGQKGELTGHGLMAVVALILIFFYYKRIQSMK